MEKDKLKVLLSRLKELVTELESEVYSDVDAYKVSPEDCTPFPIMDYDEVFNDDDGYPD